MLSSHTKVLISLLNQALVSQSSYEHIHIKVSLLPPWIGLVAAECHILQMKSKLWFLEKHKEQQQFADILEKTENI